MKPPPGGGACIDPRGMVGRIYIEDHYIYKGWSERSVIGIIKMIGCCIIP